jgi:predicted lipid-binding transport protein (Tim44 family)
LTTTGFSLDSVVTFMGTLILQVIGTGLLVLQQLLPWILALVAIGAIVWLLFRAFQFFRH